MGARICYILGWEMGFELLGLGNGIEIPPPPSSGPSTYIFQVFIGTMQTNLINLHAVAFIYAFC